ncbi:MAG TPA: TetR family transcriptional regulator [Allosphingosinicella sp.]|nr:TetR family transcriptional regulator [Allosphingosinicella sp.]
MAERQGQKSRTRKDLLEAAARLMQAGRTPTLEAAAAAAMVSRATAYRYFPGTDALLTEAALDIAMPDEGFFAGDASTEPVERLLRADAAAAAMIRANEPALRALLAGSLQRPADGLPLIEAALAPAAGLAPWARERLSNALALVMGTEARIAGKDVLRLPDEEADAVRRWMIRALVEAARRA